MPLLARSILTTIRESDPPLHVAVRVRKSRWNLVGHPRVLQAVDVAGIVQPEEQHADAVAIVVNNAWAVRHGVADIVRGREVAAQAEAHHRHRTVSYSRPSTWASSSSRPAKVLLVDGPSTMGKSQAVTSYMLRESERLRAERGRRVDRCRSPPSLAPTSPTRDQG